VRQAAELRAGDVPAAGRGGREPDRLDDAWNRVCIGKKIAFIVRSEPAKLVNP
jgi:hypothetical protein